MLIHIKNRTGTVNATAEYDSKTGTVTIKKGSLVAKELSNAPTFRGRNSMARKREGVVQDGVLIKDMQFSSLSTSATFVVGSNRNGLITWRTSDGKTMAEYLDGKDDD